MTTGKAEENPFKDPLASRYGDLGELMASLTDDEMLEYILNLNWSRERQKTATTHGLTASWSAPANGNWTAGASTLTAGGSLALQKSTATTPTTTKHENRQSSSAGVQPQRTPIQPRVLQAGGPWLGPRALLLVQASRS